MYINCKTYYSLRYGTLPTQELVQTAIDNGISSLALTNINATSDIWEFVKLCGEAGIKPITGVEIRNGDKVLYILLAGNNKGLSWIHEFLSSHFIQSKPFPEVSEHPSFFYDSKDGFIIYPLESKPLEELQSN